MTDLVIPYRKDDQTELSYTVKAYRKHLHGLGNIFVIGDICSMPGVNQVPMKAHHTRKQFNIVQKIATACTHPGISDPFICSSDDVYLLKDITVDEIKYWHNGELQKKVKYGQYQGYYKNTLEAGAIWNYDNHAPIVYHKQKFIDRVWLNQGNQDYLIQSLYCTQEQGEYMEDVKINRPLSYDEIKAKIEGHTRFSTGPNGMNNHMRRVLSELYD